MTEEKKIVERLEEFILNIDKLTQITKLKNEVNFFEITGMVYKEIKHSNFLAWLLNANANHGIGDKFIKRFMQNVIKQNKDNKDLPLDIIKISFLDFSSFIIRREWKNIDIFLVSDKEKVTITIENKIFASERRNQTLDYRSKIEPIYSDYKNLYIYLTPEGEEAQDGDYWCCADYYIVKEIIEEILNETPSLTPEVKLLLKNYVSMLRRNILKDTDLEKICIDIYREYQDVLELIYKYRPDEVESISEYIKDFLESNAEKYGIIINRDNCCKTYIRFTTKFMDKLIPISQDKTFGWNNGYNLMYEILLSENKVYCVATISNANNEDCIKLYNITQKSPKEFNITRRNAERRPILWARVFRSQPLLEKEQIQNGLGECKEALEKQLIKLLEQEIPNYEKKISERW